MTSREGSSRGSARTLRSGYRLWPLFVGVAALLLLRLPVDAHRSVWPRQQILAAMLQVESGGRANPPDGDGGLAIGPYQIHRVYWVDAVGHDPTLGGTYEDCRRRDYAERVIAAYMRLYVPQAWERGLAQTIARVHNGGPRGHRVRATEGYWQRVKRHLPQ